MKNLIKSSMLLMGLGFAGMVMAGSVLSSANTYQDLASNVYALNDPSQTLVVLDDDNTLTTMPCSDPLNVKTCQYLGGVAWGNWQTSLPDSDPRRIGPDSEVYDASTLLFAMSNESFTESDVPSVLNQLVQDGVHIMVMTARAESALNGTEAQLAQLPGGNGSNFLSFLTAHTLLTQAGYTTLPGAFLPCNTRSAQLMRYEDGIAFVDGQNKGMILQCLLPLLQTKNIKNIVFMDDTPQNDADVVAAYANQNRYQVVALVYHWMDAHRNAFTTGSMALEYQAQTVKAWDGLHQAMMQAIAQPTLS